MRKIKLVFCLRRLPSLTPEAFDRYWSERHAPLVRACAPTLKLQRYVQSSLFEDPGLAPAIDARASALPPFDGVAELWWNSLEDLLQVGATREGRAAGRLLLEDERRFVDLPNSRLIYATEREVPLAATTETTACS